MVGQPISWPWKFQISDIAVGLKKVYNKSCHIELLLEAISLERQVLTWHPIDHPYHAQSCDNLASSLWRHWEGTGNIGSLLEGIGLQRGSLALRSRQDPNRALSCISLANLLWAQHTSTGDLRLLTEAIDLQRESLTLRPPEHPDRAESCENLAISLVTRFKLTDEDALLMEAIDLQREALALRPQGHQDRALTCENLSVSLNSLYKHLDNINILDEAIMLSRESLALRPKKHPSRALSCANLANSLRELHELTKGDNLLTESIDLDRESLSLLPKGHIDRAGSCQGLANALIDQYMTTGNEACLIEAQELSRELLGLHPRGHPNRPITCTRYAGVLQAYYEHTGDDSVLLESTDLARESLAVERDVGKKDYYALSCQRLAHSLHLHYDSTGDDRFLMEAVQLQQQALALTPEGHHSRGSSCVELGNLLWKLYTRTRNNQVLDHAIQLHQEAYDLYPPGHKDRPAYCVNLINSLRARGQAANVDDVTLSSKIMTLCREAFTVCPKGHPNRAICCRHLVTSLQMCYTTKREQSLLNEILTLSEESLAIAPPGTLWRDLSVLAWVHLQINSPTLNTKRALQYLLQLVGSRAVDASQAMTSTLSCLDLVWRLKDSLDPLSDWTVLTTIYQKLVRLLPLIANPALETHSQLQALNKCSQLGSDAFVCAALSGTESLGLESLEIAQGFLWSQSLHYRDPQFNEVPELLADQLQGLLHEFTTSTQSQVDFMAEGDSFLTPNDVRHGRSSRIYALLSEIRALPGLENFMLGETFSTLASVAFDHPVVVLVGARKHFYALILRPQSEGPTLLRLGDLEAILNSTNDELRRDTRGGATIVNKGSDQIRAMAITQRGNFSPLSRRLKDIWLNIVKPVLDCLGVQVSCFDFVVNSRTLTDIQPSEDRSRPRLHWCPTGLFSALPLHAAGIYEGQRSVRVCCSEYVASSYTPNLTTLLRAQSTSFYLSRNELSVALVAEGQAHDNLPMLHEVDAEVNSVDEIASLNQVQAVHRISSPTTIIETCAAMQRANVVHLACHGVQDSTDATQSGFCLGDGRLTISRPAVLAQVAYNLHVTSQEQCILHALQLFAPLSCFSPPLCCLRNSQSLSCHLSQWMLENTFNLPHVCAFSPHII
jgi:hypothetical protein